jgi:hypothetical protein
MSGWMSKPDHHFWTIVQSFWKGLRRNLFIVVGVVGTILLWPARKSWKNEYRQRLAIFLLTTYLILFLMHMWAALSGTSCGFTCFKGYLMFFSNIGLFLIIISHQHWVKQMPLWRNIMTGVFVSYFLLELEHWNSTWQGSLQRGVRQILNVEIPWFTSKDVIPVWGLLENYFSVELKFIEQTLYSFSLWAIPLAFVWIFIPLVIWGLRKYKLTFNYYGWMLFTGMLFFSGLLSPLKSIGGELNAKQCKSDVINSHEMVGDQLYSKIPARSKVYWGIESWMMFLYIPEVEIFPPQTMIHYRYLPNTSEMDIDFLQQHGYWNEVLKDQWIGDADFILVEGRYYTDEWRPRVESGELSLVDITPPFEECRGDNSRIIILQKNNGEK